MAWQCVPVCVCDYSGQQREDNQGQRTAKPVLQCHCPRRDVCQAELVSSPSRAYIQHNPDRNDVKSEAR